MRKELYLVVFGEVKGEGDDVLHCIARGEDQLANVDRRSHSGQLAGQYFPESTLYILFIHLCV